MADQPSAPGSAPLPAPSDGEAALRNAADSRSQPISGRLATLDLIRGVAILGILAINIAGFAGPSIGAISPNLPAQGTWADNVAYGFAFLFFEGKMRAIFAMLFGASLLLYVERNEAAGREGDALQVRRLFWLMVFGWLHYLLLWWGDILFTYGVCGLAALMLRGLSNRVLLPLAFALYLVWSGWGFITQLPAIAREEAVRQGLATPSQIAASIGYLDQLSIWAEHETQRYLSDFLTIFLTKVHEEPTLPWNMTAASFGEVLPLMLIGMLLYRTGFFAGRWPERTLRATAIAATVTGLVVTGLALLWLAPRGFPPVAMRAGLLYGLAVPHLLAALGYMAMLILITPRLSATAFGERLIAAGRTAFSNYIGTSLLMTALFYGWGFGLFGRFGAAAQWGFVMLGWTTMFIWSRIWLKRYRRGPLEWAWRSLVSGTWLQNRRNEH